MPYAIVIGDREVEAGAVAPRRRGGENLAPMPVDALIQLFQAEVAQERGEA
ncbi:MAG TPA: His/Gly/Thr/Pro-type tRNA ligase C-terminal domain-containing protein [Methylomirabilota bacterium]|nr:His/Gly/Thr/Pro-type tRNA ligase C-terminal domain-containing protein [Methylomirabilota bacterium]